MPTASSARRQSSAQAVERGHGVSPRAIGIALAMLLALAFLDFYVEMAWGKTWGVGGWWFASGAPSVVPLSALFILTLVMALPVVRRWGLTRRELLVIYSILLVGVPTVSHAVLAWMLVRVVGYYYGAQAQPHWETSFLHYVPEWWAPSSRTAVEGFFQGHVAVPWGEWAVPLAAWSSFAFGVFIASVCLMALVQRQWIRNERLPFPLAQVPLEMVGDPEVGASGPGQLAAASLFWVGALIAFGVNFLSTISAKVPALPHIPLFIEDLIPWQKVGPLAGLGGLTLVLWPWMIALAFLIPADLSFSLWAFTIIRLLLTVGAIAAGATPQRPEEWWGSGFPAPSYQGTGAVLALALWVLWVARKHLARAVRIALSRQSGRADAEEPLSYRAAYLGLILASGCLVYFLWASGSRMWVGLTVVVLTMAYFAVWARLRAENGMAFIAYPCLIDYMLGIQLGNSMFRRVETVAMITLRWVYQPGFSNSFEIFPGSALEAFKIADSAGIDPRKLARAIGLGFAFAWAIGVVIVLTGIYRYGWLGLACSRGGWLGPASITGGGEIIGRLDPSEPDLNAVIGVLAGAAVTIALGVMRLHFWWWPLHPIGYLASNTWGAQWWFIPFFIGWAGKVLVTRYGGLRLYRRAIPLAVGIIAGDLLNGMVWALIQAASRGSI